MSDVFCFNLFFSFLQSNFHSCLYVEKNHKKKRVKSGILQALLWQNTQQRSRVYVLRVVLSRVGLRSMSVA